MSLGRRVHNWLVGRHDFRALVEIDPEVAAEHGGRPIPGTGCAEFALTAAGSRASARIDAVAALRAELPDATVLALLDGGPPVDPAPFLHLVAGGRPRLLLVGGEDTADAQARLARVAGLWELPPDRYSVRPVADPEQRRRRVRSVALGLPFGVPVAVLLLARSFPGTDGTSMFGPIVEGDPVLPAVLGAVALLPGAAAALRAWWRRCRPSREEWVTAVVALLPVAALAVVFGVAAGTTALAQQFPAFAAVLVGGLAVAAAPLLVSAVEGPVWRAALGWGLPLLAGGIAPFTGELLLELYLSAFGISRTEVQVSFWAQWLLGAAATGAALVGVYVGVAFWVVFRRFGRPATLNPLMGLMAGLIGLVYLLTVVQATVIVVGQRASPGVDGLLDPLFGLTPRLACVAPTDGPYSFVGRSAPPTATPVIYFGRADGRLAVWSAESGGVSLDGQAVTLRFVEQGASCN